MSYVIYSNDASIKGLDINHVQPQTASEFPTDFYRKNPFQPAYYVTDITTPRDIRQNYLYKAEIFHHPDHQSRFGYANCWNGYCYGHVNRYVTPDNEKACTGAQPKGMAPERFYHGRFQSPFNAEGQAYIDAKNARKHRG